MYTNTIRVKCCYFQGGRDALSSACHKDIAWSPWKTMALTFAVGKTMLSMNSRPSALGRKSYCSYKLNVGNTLLVNIKRIYKLQSSI